MTATEAPTAMADREAIRDIIENWVIRRDGGQWDALLRLFHDDGIMSSTWKQSSAKDFVAGARSNWNRGVFGQHSVGGTAIDLGGETAPDRAVAQTRMTIGRRARLHGVLVDVTCVGRFYDFLERRSARWGIVMRQPIYESDRMDAVVPGEIPSLDRARLAGFPDGFRHLAYLQAELGVAVNTAMPGRVGPEIDALYARGAAWLAGMPGHPADSDFGR